jgi:cell division protein FtsL
MKRVLRLIAALLVIGSVGVLAHGDALHVRGTVTQITGQSVTIQPSTKGAKALTFTVADHTEIDKVGKVAAFKDLKVGDRVAVEIPKNKTEAVSIKIGAAPAAKPTAAADHKHKG